MKYYDEKAPEGHVDIISLIRKGQLAIAEAGHEKEKTRVGHLRGGSAGAIIDGEVYGECHRKAHLRMLGIDTPLKEEIEQHSLKISVRFVNNNARSVLCPSICMVMP